MALTVAVRRWAASTAALGSYIPYVGVVALFLAAPFEKRHPTITLPAQSFTNVELIMLAVLAGWTTWWLVRGERPRVRTALTVPAFLLVGSMLLSAVMAPAYRWEALHFTARFLVGFLVYLLVVNSVTSQRQIMGLLIAAGLAGSVVAVLGVLEYYQVPAVVRWLKPFGGGQILVGGRLRVSSTLQYPTITSMYLEMMFGLTLGWLLWAVAEGRRWMAVAVFIALGLMAETIILTLSRSGLIVMAGMLAVAGGLWSLRRGLDRAVGVIAALAVVIAGLLGYRLLSDSLLWLRLTTENDESWYIAQYQVPSRLELQTGQVRHVAIRLTNRGRATWQPDGPAPFRLSYHWLSQDGGKMLIFEGLRTDFPRPVRPGESIRLRARVQAPPQPGHYRLAWDVVQEGRLWFSTKRSPSAYSLVLVQGAPAIQVQPTPMPVPRPNLTVDRRTLWRLAGQMLVQRPLTGVGPDNFRLLYGKYAGLKSWNRGLHTNNMYIEFFVDLGLIGGGLFLWLLWRVLTTLRVTWRRTDLTSLPLFLGIVAATAAFLLHGFVDYFFEFTPTYLIIWMTLGLATALEIRSKHAHRV